MLFTNALLAAASLSLANAAPRPRSTLTAQTLEAISSSTSSCTGADFPAECATASDAVGPITASFSKYGISSVGEQAALIALMMYESGSFKYNHNHYPAPGRPGQGTRNMQMFPYNLKYASSLLDAATVNQANTAGPDAVLALVNGLDDSFGSAAWFLSTQCSSDIRSGLAAQTSAGWSAYLTQCVGTTDTADRDALWTASLQALNGAY